MRLKQLFSPARIGIILGLATRQPISPSTLERHTSFALYIPGTLLHSPSRNMHTNFLLNCFVLSVDFGTKKPSKTLISFKICPIPRAIVTIYWIQSHSKCCKAHSIMRKCKLLNTNYNYSPCPLSLEVKKAGYNAPHIFNSPSPDSAELLAVDLLINNFTWFRIATRAKNSHIFHLCH